MIFGGGVRDVRKAIRFYGLYDDYSDSELDDFIRINKLRKDIICGVVFITRAVTTTDYIKHTLAFTPYTDEKSAKIAENDQRISEKNQTFAIEKQENFRRNVEKLFEISVIHPGQEKYPVTDYYSNPEIFTSLYSVIIQNSTGKKKMK